MMAKSTACASWQVCPACGAPTFVWRDPEYRPLPHQPIVASLLAHPDGRPCLAWEGVRCPACGLTAHDPGSSALFFAAHLQRWGKKVPLVSDRGE
jgi:hypothetical protein